MTWQPIIQSLDTGLTWVPEASENRRLEEPVVLSWVHGWALFPIRLRVPQGGRWIFQPRGAQKRKEWEVRRRATAAGQTEEAGLGGVDGMECKGWETLGDLPSREGTNPPPRRSQGALSYGLLPLHTEAACLFLHPRIDRESKGELGILPLTRTFIAGETPIHKWLRIPEGWKARTVRPGTPGYQTWFQHT